MKKINVFIGLCLALLIASISIAAAENESIDQEVDEYENSTTGDDTINLIDSHILTDEQIAHDLNMNETELNEIRDVIDTIGLRQYVLNRQLKQRVFVSIVQGDAIIEYLDSKNISHANLTSVLDETRTLYNSIEPKKMTAEQYNETLTKAKDLVVRFRDTARLLVPAGELPALMKRINNYMIKNKDKIDDLNKFEWKARAFYNRKQMQESMKRMNQQMKEMRKRGMKLMHMEPRMWQFENFTNMTWNANFTKDQIKDMKQRWDDQQKEFGLDRALTEMKNQRAQMAIEVAKIRKQMMESQKAGLNTSDLDKQIEDLRNEIANMTGNHFGDVEKAKAGIIKARINNLQKSEEALGKMQGRMRQEREKLEKDLKENDKKNQGGDDE